MPGSAVRAGATWALKASAAVADAVQQPRRGVVILLYHRVGARTGVAVDLSADLFEQQIGVLAAEGRAISLDEGLVVLGRTAPPPTADPVVVTFDDGTSDFADIAVPILERHRVPAILYLATDFVERRRSFPDNGKPISWPGLRDAISTGLVTVGSHTHSHALFDRLGPDAAAQELEVSKALIEDHLQVEARHFAYPKALPATGAVEGLVRRTFQSAAIGGMTPNVYGATDVYRLTRSAVQTSDGMRWFRRKLGGGMAFEEQVRRRLNRRRYVGAVS